MKFPSQKQYSEMIEQYAPKSPLLKDCVLAFLIGGLICAIGQGLIELYLYFGISKDISTALCSVTLVFLSAFFTGLGLYDELAKHAGAGTLVPITGFANAVVSPAIEFKTEGLVLGLGAKMFIIAGPVLVYGIFASVIYGVVYWVIGLF